MMNVGDSVKLPMQSKRESAYLWQGTSGRYANAPMCRTLGVATARSSKRAVVDCQRRYPSPDRSALYKGGPVTFFRRLATNIAIDIGYQPSLAIECIPVGVNFDATSQIKLGRRLCRKNQSSLPQWLCLALPVVLKATWNVALQAQALVLSLQ
jgi:hypothetical protein